jgi:peptide/nickel transport system permease protein
VLVAYPLYFWRLILLTFHLSNSRIKRVLGGLSSVAITLLGLLALTFFIGRVMPIDPVLSVIGPDADNSTYEQVYQEMGLDKPCLL